MYFFLLLFCIMIEMMNPFLKDLIIYYHSTSPAQPQPSSGPAQSWLNSSMALARPQPGLVLVKSPHHVPGPHRDHMTYSCI
jgi:hypothetical protein